MTVIVTRSDGGSDEYMRNGDVYVTHHDGALDIIRVGAKRPYHYEPAAWTDVTGDQKARKAGRFW
ncbi:hypothetical protein BST36_25550 [Mycolicibacterium moriokaense]|jgi:hypothetical protein|uniref:Uncharacterized protein n=1 Tax=Mycolicibacterium moriokaense TaxID=39691 RepID=A0AAD1M9K3_9MYCO|nr:hypothetical protein [Mycolicibacterium moriokaense]MCV7042859.1 hypothetical protein [Mycolicibacterium moriokaense]ORB16735.1 hypothetical protein BST36_25550 [Mycolicibacterium moriokaense]BBX04590.1 hypothetical protein MMOR_55260 [Mycolicibacterium moriokaense]